MSVVSRPWSWHFSVDRYINPWLPGGPPFRLLPQPVAHFFGHRPPGRHPRPLGNLVAVFWAFVGVFCGISVIEVVGRAVPSFRAREAPLIIGSFGAAAVLEFYAIESPLSQPRNAVLGQLLSSLTGVAVAKLYGIGGEPPAEQPPSSPQLWTAGALACACATALMALTGTVHPPAGATALLAVVDRNVARLGWFLVPVMMLGCLLMQAVALAVNNVQRRFPLYWWTPEEVGQAWRRRGGGRRRERDGTGRDDKETGPETKGDGGKEEEGRVGTEGEGGSGVLVEVAGRGGEHGRGGEGKAETDTEGPSKEVRVVVGRGRVVVPDGVSLTPEELLFLEGLSTRLSWG